jgi:2-iminobutanoate/2-iminopropanoate deaminase
VQPHDLAPWKLLRDGDNALYGRTGETALPDTVESSPRYLTGKRSKTADLRQSSGAGSTGAIYTGDGMSTIQRFDSQYSPAPYGPYVHAVAVGEWIFLSGQNGRDPLSAQLVEGGVRPQTERAIRNIETVLLDLGSSLKQVVRTTVYLRDLGEFAAMNEIYFALFGQDLPARSTIQAPLPFGALVALDAVAHRNGSALPSEQRKHGNLQGRPSFPSIALSCSPAPVRVAPPENSDALHTHLTAPETGVEWAQDCTNVQRPEDL